MRPNRLRWTNDSRRQQCVVLIFVSVSPWLTLTLAAVGHVIWRQARPPCQRPVLIPALTPCSSRAVRSHQFSRQTSVVVRPHPRFSGEQGPPASAKGAESCSPASQKNRFSSLIVTNTAKNTTIHYRQQHAIDRLSSQLGNPNYLYLTWPYFYWLARADGPMETRLIMCNEEVKSQVPSNRTTCSSVQLMIQEFLCALSYFCNIEVHHARLTLSPNLCITFKNEMFSRGLWIIIFLKTKIKR